MDEKQNQNFMLAVVLSMLVVAAWSYFVAWPRAHQEQLRREMEAKQAASQTQTVAPQTGAASGVQPAAGTSAPAAAGDAVALFATRAAALDANPRLAIDAPAMTGSIALRGARFDDVVLKNYHETVDPTSPNVVLLSPQGFKDGYFAGFDWLDADGKAVVGAQTVWQAPAGVKLTLAAPVTLTTDLGNGLSIKRTLTVDDHYMFTVKDEVANASAKDVSLRPSASLERHGEPVVLNQSFEGFVSGSPVVRVQQTYYSALKSAAGPDYKDVGGWLGFTDKYWAATLIPPQDLPYQANLARSSDAVPVYKASYAGQSALTIPAGQSKSVESRLFAGAKEVETIAGYESKGLPLFSYIIDWGWFWYITKPMFYLIDYLYKGVGAFWAAMLLVTVIVKAAFFPLANMSFSSMARMKKLQPEMQKIQERFKDDKVRQQQATMELYKTQGVNPMIGCVPVLLQIPVFFALYKVLYTSLEMRHQPFVGWVRDLSAPDPSNLFNLFGLLPYSVPDSIPYLHLGVWPIIMGITMWFQMKLNPPPPDPVQARMFAFMPIMFTFMLGTMPAGLVIYWAWNNSLTILQQSMIMKRQGVKVEIFDNVKKSFSEGATFVRGLFKGRGGPPAL
jgi:YidC/Oxa1 family membrane protein insertase